MKKFFKPIVLVMLATSMAIVSCVPNREEIDGIKNDIAALKDKVAANEVDVKAQIGTLQYLLQSYKDEVNPKLVALDAQLKKDYADLSAADAALDKAIKDAQTVLQAAIAKNADDIAANKKEIQAAIAEYKKLVANAIEGFELAMAKAKEDQALVDGAQNMAIEALSAQFETFKEAIDEAINNLGIKVDELAAAVEEMGDDIEDLQQQVDDNLAASYAYTDALAVTVDAAMGVLEERIAANEAAIKKLNEETIPEIEEAILALQTSIVGLEGNVAALDEKKLDKSVFEAFLKEYTEWKATIDNSIKSINGSIELLKMYDEIIAGSVEQLTDLVNRLNGSEVVPGSIKQQIKDAIAAVYVSITKDLEALKTDIEGKIETLQTDVKSLKGSLEDANAEIAIINGKLKDVKDAIEDIDDEIAAAQGDIKDLQDAKTKLENDLKALEAALESRMKAVEELTAGLKKQIETITGDEKTEGSIAYAVEQLRASLQTQIDDLAGKVNKNAEDIAELQKQIGLLQQRIQSLVFVPQYQDLKFGIPFTEVAGTYKAYNSENGFPVVYKVAPAELAKPLAKAVNDAIAKGVTPVFTFDIESGLQTRATDTDPQLIFKDASGDEETGKMTFHLKHMNFVPKGGTLDQYAISLRADNDEYKVHVASEYVQAKLHKFGTITIKTDYIYKPNISTGEVDDASKIQTGVAQNLDIQYTDGATHTFVEGYELAAEDTESHKIRTISQWKSLGYEMPDVNVTVTEEPVATRTDNIVATLNGTSSTFAVKIMDGLKDNMIKTKADIGSKNNYKFAFNYGAASPVNVVLDVNITKYDGAFQVKLPYTMTWTYDLDEDVDHANINKPVDTWVAYTRSGKVDYKEHSKFLVKPYLTVGDKDFLVDGSNNVFGLEPSDFDSAGAFAPATGTTLPTTTSSFDIYHRFDGELSLTQYDVPGERLGKTYEYVGSYGLNKYSTKADITKVIINTVDRKTEDIKITAPEKVVKLLGDEYKSGDIYDISSASLTNALMTAYINQGIFDSKYPQKDAFETEFKQDNISYIDHTGHSAKFNIVSSAGTVEPGDETFVIKSNADFQSPVLRDVASNYGSEPWTLTVQTYVGQKVIITWPVKAEPLHPYRFVTYGLDSQNAIQVPMVWVNGKDNITKAQTEVDVIKYNNANVKVKYTEGSTETTVEYGKFADKDIKLVPRFSLVNLTDGIAVANSGTADLNCISNVTYYGQAASVGIKSSLFVKSGNIEFLVPGSDQMYVGGTPVTSITVKQVNPIADTQDPIGTVTNVASTGTGDVSLTMKDILGNSLYANGDIQNKQTPYKEDVKAIFGSVKFSVYTVGGSSATTGWTLYGADSFGISDTPSKVQLMTNAVATGSYDVVIRARTLWKDYYYTVKVNVN